MGQLVRGSRPQFLPEYLAERGTHLRAGVYPELIAEQRPDALVVRQGRRLLSGGGQHENQPRLK